MESQWIHIGDRDSLIQKIKERRLELGYTQRQLAAHSGVAQKTISRIETGKDNTSIICLLAIMNALEVGVFFGHRHKTKEPA